MCGASEGATMTVHQWGRQDFTCAVLLLLFLLLLLRRRRRQQQP